MIVTYHRLRAGVWLRDGVPVAESHVPLSVRRRAWFMTADCTIAHEQRPPRARKEKSP